MLTVSTQTIYTAGMARKRRSYHHGDLRRALLEETTRTIQREGVDAVTLRAVGKRLGVSRTALYRHFADKPALLAAVAREGFQAFTRDLTHAWTSGGGGRAGFRAMGAAYVKFAVANPSHYRVMFGAFKDLCERDAQLAADAQASFQVLLDAVVMLQKDGLLRADPPQTLAQYIWAAVHGVAMLAIDGQLGPDPKEADTLARFALERLSTGIAPYA
jgi:AcrR family transcriptional regulator